MADGNRRGRHREKGTRNENEDQQLCDIEADGLEAWVDGVGRKKKNKYSNLITSFRRLKP